jgi:hypothetical protein
MLVGHVVFALFLLKAHQRDLVLGDEPVDRHDKLLADRIRQTRRRETRPAVVGKERGDPTRVGQLAHIGVAIHAIDAIQLEDHMVAQHACGRQG